jgi:hypothetical protein
MKMGGRAVLLLRGKAMRLLALGRDGSDIGTSRLSRTSAVLHAATRRSTRQPRAARDPRTNE